MKIRHAFIFAMVLTLLIANIVYLFSNLKDEESAIITRVIDGDTLEINNATTIRLLNINTPEKNSLGFEEAKNFLISYENKNVVIEKAGKEKYGRTLARIYSPEYINLELVKNGLATKFLVDESERSLFARAEKLAIENERGMWKKSDYFGCFKADINPKKEMIKLESKCGRIDIENWLIKDESRKKYKFEKHDILTINVHSFSGEDNGTDIFWNEKNGIWNDDRDSLYIFDSGGKIVHYESYGY